MKRKRMCKAVILLLSLLVVTVISCGMAKEKPRREIAASIPVLGYHHLAEDAEKFSSWLFDPWTSSLSAFEKQMQYLFDNGYKTISLDDFYAWYKGEKQFDNKTVVLTFDDSYYSTVALAKPVLEKYGFQATVFVIGGSVPDVDTGYQAPSKQHIPLALLQSDETLQYYSHFYCLHRKIGNAYAVDAYTQDELCADIRQARQTASTDYMAYPYGKYNETVQAALKQEGVRLAFSYNQMHDACRTENPYALSRYSVNAYTPMFLFRWFLNRA